MSPEGTIFCLKCGMQLPALAQFCSRCGAAIAQAPPPAPAAAAPRLPLEGPVVVSPPAMLASAVAASPVGGPSTYAGFWLRFAAIIIDAILIEFVIIPVSFMVGVVVGIGGVGADRAVVQLIAGVLGGLCGLLIYWLYFALFESSAKQSTLGKRVVGLYVTDLSGNRISFARATGRHFAKLISSATLLIGYMMAGFTEKKQALHDMIAGTLVLRRSPSTPIL